jgi:NAD-dependent deacetylase
VFDGGSVVNLVVLTGAGISAESGLATFRAADGLWVDQAIEDVCTPDAFARDPNGVCQFYDERKSLAARAQPNAAHRALAALEQYWREHSYGDFLLVTQNVDDLHERAGSKNLIHMHGRLNSAFCIECGFQMARHGPLEDSRECPICQLEALRPDIVFFGEAPRGLPQIQAALKTCHLFVAAGTSGTVFPAAGFAQEAGSHGAKRLLLNLVRPEFSEHFSAMRLGPASQIVPEWVSEIVDTAANVFRSDGQ